ncbi:hypothetical protein HU200_008857 [Digitaria exilis]|uniref:Uncharacterized protein n=1 Tax=Digitaria exilis TaxID=1010633 RepID=A0A835FN51_9POAL|nr:hypothetical protein HU200_008857 [Digitaria exilis]
MGCGWDPGVGTRTPAPLGRGAPPSPAPPAPPPAPRTARRRRTPARAPPALPRAPSSSSRRSACCSTTETTTTTKRSRRRGRAAGSAASSSIGRRISLAFNFSLQLRLLQLLWIDQRDGERGVSAWGARALYIAVGACGFWETGMWGLCGIWAHISVGLSGWGGWRVRVGVRRQVRHLFSFLVANPFLFFGFISPNRHSGRISANLFGLLVCSAVQVGCWPFESWCAVDLHANCLFGQKGLAKPWLPNYSYPAHWASYPVWLLITHVFGARQ